MVTGLKKIQAHARAFARQLRLGGSKGSEVTLVDLDDHSRRIGKDAGRLVFSMDLDDIFNPPSYDSAIGMCEFPASSTSKNPGNDPGPPTEENNKGRSQEDVEGISAAQEKKLKTRSAASKTEHQRWFDVYRILFADDDPSTFTTPCWYSLILLPPSCSGDNQTPTFWDQITRSFRHSLRPSQL